ncbi:MAG: ATP-binding protein [Lautropia sp.]
MPPNPYRFNPWLVAIAVACIGMLSRALLAPALGPHLPLAGAVPAILLAAWYGGPGPGLLALAICAVWSLLQPFDALQVEPPSTAVRVLVLLPAGLLLCLLAGQLHLNARRAQARTAELERLARPSQRLQAALELTAVSVADVDLDLRYTFVHKPPRGLTVAQMVGHRAEEFHDPRSAAQLTTLRRRIIATGRPERTELELVRPDGTEWYDWIGGPLLDADDRIVGVTALVLDITTRKQAELALQRREEALRLLVELHDAAAGLTNPAALQAVSVARIGQHFAVDRCGWAEFGDDYATLRMHPDRTTGLAGVAGEYPLGATAAPLLEALREGHPIAIADVDHDAGAADVLAAAAAWTAGARSLLLAPVLESGRLVALLCLQQATPRPWRSEEITLARQAAQRVALKLGNARTQVALRESRDVLALAMRSGRMGAWSRDFATDSVWWSRELEEIFGLAPDGFAGHREGFLGFIHPDDRRAVVARIQRALDRKEDYSVEFRFLHASGQWRWMEGRGHAVYGADDRPTFSFGLGIDITDRKAAEEERQRLHAELAAELERKDEFLATLAHELRNPLAPIVTALDVFRLRMPPDPQLEWSRGVIERQVRHMTRLVDDLLDIARLSTGKSQLRIARVDLAEVLRDALDSTRTLIEAAGHRLSISTPETPIAVEVDATRLAQVVANLLSNAAKYTPAPGHVRLSVERRDRQLLIAVADDGIGIAPGHLDEIFNMFAQVKPVLERTHGGLGIGLALSRRLVEQHGGTLVAASPGAGRGSVFTVTLPCPVDAAATDATTPATEATMPATGATTAATSMAPAAAAVADAGGDMPSTMSRADTTGLDEHSTTAMTDTAGTMNTVEIPNTTLGTDTTTGPTTTRGRRILVVDDNIDAAESLTMLLEIAGHQATMAHDGIVAVEAAEAFRPDAILLDIGLPKLNGYEVARRIRAQPWGRSINIIAVTGWGQDKDRQLALDAGCDHHLTKPLDTARLEALLSQHAAPVLAAR